MLRLPWRRAAPRLCAALSSEARVSISESLILSFDTETTGIDTAESRVVELGAVYFRGASRIGPQRRMFAVHGISDATVASSPSFLEVGPRFVQHLIRGPDVEQPEPPLLLGYNAVGYDAPLLNAEFARHCIHFAIDAERVLDPRRWPPSVVSAPYGAYGAPPSAERIDSKERYGATDVMQR
ncbi:ribonuclease H-like domain-containing protein [Pelagophyceae sp. CCMP2097]|nr:ribonuclease H-like domain-containing protein [Pelagophyceae sp. CCMP2097]